MESRSKKPMRVLLLVLVLALAPLATVAAEEDPWKFLNGFAMVPDSPALIEDHYIATLFVSQDKRELAVVIFNATCDSGNCAIHHRAAYSVFDRQGSNVRRYIDPSDQELLRLISDHLGA
jgi:hypothetical protein